MYNKSASFWVRFMVCTVPQSYIYNLIEPKVNIMTTTRKIIIIATLIGAVQGIIPLFATNAAEPAVNNINSRSAYIDCMVDGGSEATCR